MTVWRVINREENVRPEARELVGDAIHELNYTPSPAARSLAGSEPFRVGLLYDNPSTGYLSEFLLGALDERRSHGRAAAQGRRRWPDPAAAAVRVAAAARGRTRGGRSGCRRGAGPSERRDGDDPHRQPGRGA